MDMTELVLRAADLELALIPGIGGSIAHFRRGGFPLMRETSPDTRDVGLFACFPLIPFSNRVGGGRFSFAGQSYQLRRDPSTGGAHAIHGVGRRRAWQVAEKSGSSVRLTLTHSAGEALSWPFPFRAEQHFVLAPNGLVVTLVLTNTGPRAAPAGIGLHPYFPRHDAVALQFPAEAVWQNGADQLPSARIAVPAEWNFSASRTLAEPALDNCFAGWSGTAEISWPAAAQSLTITADPVFGHAVVYTPSGRDYFAFEPVSHMNDAINRMALPDNGLAVLEPGAALRGIVRFTVTAIGPA